MSTLWSHVHIFSLTLSGKNQCIWFVKVNCGFAINTKAKTMAHYIDVIMTTMASQITILTVVYSIVYSGVDQGKHQSSASLTYVRGIHRDRWIPRRKGLLRGKCFHLMTSSCSIWLRHRSFASWGLHKLWCWPCWINRSSTMSDWSTRVTSVSTNAEDVFLCVCVCVCGGGW